MISLFLSITVAYVDVFMSVLCIFTCMIFCFAYFKRWWKGEDCSL